MIHELTVQEFKKVGLLFQPIMVYQPFCGAVLAGIHPGRVFVDDPTRPKTSFMVRPDGWCFLVGELEAEGFKQSLKQALFRKEIIGKGDFTLLLTCQPQEWGEKLVSIFQPVELFLQNRRHYLCHALNYNWRIDLPVDFSVHPMDESLLKRKDLNPPDEIVESIRKWRKLTSSGFRDFGFVIIHEKDERRLKIAGWATIDAVVEGFGDIGFFYDGGISTERIGDNSGSSDDRTWVEKWLVNDQLDMRGLQSGLASYRRKARIRASK